MKRHLVTSALALLLAISATPAFAREALVIIRFNQARVYYDNQLYQAISKAVAIKPDLMIDVVSYSPETNDTDTDEQWQQAASQHTQQVVSTLQKIGVPRSRISVSGERRAGIRTDETHIFVQ
ncbi:MAG: hypothetical protein DI582_01975 [Azospirillum brasilense]|nr:MAG: hypothetical protein DI582_01975 [Azospirillum brasilense]